ncbi:MAG: CDP-alcohol phosphatidyltransferase family protein [bacterium]
MGKLLEDYRKGLKPLVVEEWVDLLVYRPLGFFVALPLKFTPVSPNFVTLASALAGLLGAVAMAFGRYDWLVWGAILYAFSNVLDCSDGQLARMTGTFSRYGRIYDGVADYVVGLSTFLALGIGWRPEGYTLPGWWALVIFGGIASTSYHAMHLNHVRQAYLRAIEHSSGEHVIHRGKKKRKKSRKMMFFYLPFYFLYRTYLWVERAVRRQVRLPLELPEEVRHLPSLRLVLVLWTFTGKGTHVTLLTIFLLLGKPEDYLWFCLIPGTLWVLMVELAHLSTLRILNRKLESLRDESPDTGRRSVGSDGRTDNRDAQNASASGRPADLELDVAGSQEQRD